MNEPHEPGVIMSKSEAKRLEVLAQAKLAAPEKTSAWSDEEREQRRDDIVIEHPKIPPWLNHFSPGNVVDSQGWQAVVRHVGCEDGRWMVLIEPFPTPPQESRGAQRAEFRRVRKAMGKKAAKKLQRTGHPSEADVSA